MGMLSNYDRNLKVTGLGISPWPRLGPQKWFKDYRICAASDWDISPKVAGLELVVPNFSIAPKKTETLINQPSSKQLFTKGELKHYRILPYKPFELPDWLPAERVLANSHELYARLENKALFREEFSDITPFPEFVIYDKDKMPGVANYQDLRGQFGVFVLQDDVLSGGQGTYIVSNQEEYKKARKELLLSRGSRVVASKFIDGSLEGSLQSAVTRFGIAVGPLQQQFVREPLLCSIGDQVGDKFCGAQISANAPQHLQMSMYETAQAIGKRLQKLGYKGIFGLDLLFDPNNGEFFVIELNARTTGVTPLHSMFDSNPIHTPFYPLHILELAGADYKMDNSNFGGPGKFTHDCSLLVLNVRDGESHSLNKSPRSGLYGWDGSRLSFESLRVGFRDDLSSKEVVLQVYQPAHANLKPGARLAFVFTKWLVKDKRGNFSPEAMRLIEEIYKQFNL